jgi:hypothetical protein
LSYDCLTNKEIRKKWNEIEWKGTQ